MKQDVDKIIEWMHEYCGADGGSCKDDCRKCTACPQLHYVFEQLDKLVTDEAAERLCKLGISYTTIRLAENNYRDAETKEKCCGTCGNYGTSSSGSGGWGEGKCLEYECCGVEAGKVCDRHRGWVEDKA